MPTYVDAPAFGQPVPEPVLPPGGRVVEVDAGTFGRVKLVETPFEAVHDGSHFQSANRDAARILNEGIVYWPKCLVGLTYSDPAVVFAGHDLNPEALDARERPVGFGVQARKGVTISGRLQQEIT